MRQSLDSTRRESRPGNGTLAALSALCLLGGLGSLAAQSPSHTIPANMQAREGSSRHWVPSHVAPSRAQTIYRHSIVDFPTRNISRLWLRPDSSTEPSVAHTFRMTLRMASRNVPEPDQVFGESYLENRGDDTQVVLNDQPIDFPAHTGNGAGPEPWLVSIPIQPFPYVSGRNLMLEWRAERPASGPSSEPWYLDAQLYYQEPVSGYFLRDNERNACPDRFTTYSGAVGGPGQTCSIWFYSLGASGLPATTYLGQSRDVFRGSVLPFDLTPFGAPGCHVYASLEIGIMGVTDPTPGLGRYRVDLLIPEDPSLARMEIFTQTFVSDPTVPGMIRASDRGRIVVGRVPQRYTDAVHLYSYQNAIDDVPEFITFHAPVVGLR